LLCVLLCVMGSLLIVLCLQCVLLCMVQLLGGVAVHML
jgi:hypothetical protein